MAVRVAGVKCGAAPTPPHSTAQVSGSNPGGQTEVACSGEQVFEASCPASCDHGYTGKSPEHEDFECGSDGQWTGTLDCPAVECSGDLDTWQSVFGHGSVPPECQDISHQKTFNDTCQVTCDEGYTRSSTGNQDTVTAIYTCAMQDGNDRSTTGTWQGLLPTDSGNCDGARLSCSIC